MTDISLEVRDLHVRFDTPHGVVHAVRGVGFRVGREKVAIVGESGSGKSMTGRAILRITPRNARISAARMALDGEDLLDASEKRMREIRGQRGPRALRAGSEIGVRGRARFVVGSVATERLPHAREHRFPR